MFASVGADVLERAADCAAQSGADGGRSPADDPQRSVIFDGVHVHSLIDPVLNRRIEVSYEGSIKFVTWNSGPDFSRFGGADDPEFGKRFVCVEGGTLYRDRAYTLNPGETHVLKMTVRVK